MVDNTWSDYKYNSICARATLYPGKTIEEVIDIIDIIDTIELKVNYEKRNNRTKYSKVN